MSTLTPEPTTSTYWVRNRTWRDPETRLEQEVEHTAFGTPRTPADAGRMAVDAHADDLRKLADS
jgi:hypothetical protein